MLKRSQRFSRIALTLGALACGVGVAEAGPPLICHAFDAGKAPLLPWTPGDGWNTPDRAYDVQRLTADTMRLLSPEAPVLARMENLRRATIYAAKDRRVAAELLAAVLGRALTTAATDSREPLALVRRRIPHRVVPPSEPRLQVGHALERRTHRLESSQRAAGSGWLRVRPQGPTARGSEPGDGICGVLDEGGANLGRASSARRGGRVSRVAPGKEPDEIRR